MLVRSQQVPEVPGLAEWELQQREVLQAERRLRAGQDGADKPDTTTTNTTEMSTEKTDLSTLPPELKSILKMSFKKLLSILQQKTTDENEQSSRSNPTSRPSFLPTETQASSSSQPQTLHNKSQDVSSSSVKPGFVIKDC